MSVLSRPVAALVLALTAWCGTAALALDDITLRTPGASDSLREALRDASLTFAARRDRRTGADDIYAAARADYARLLGALYNEGHYGGVISITIDGREAAAIDALDLPAAVSQVVITVDPGPRFRFASARMRPYAPGTVIPPEYADTAIARATAISDAARAGVEGWRQTGHAKARVAGQEITANHPAATVDALVLLDPGPRVTFGRLIITGTERMKPGRLRRISGFPTRDVFDPDALDRVSDRLRRTGVFSAFTLREADRPNPDGSLDYTLTVTEEKLRRFGFGAEIASFDGLSVSGFWLHRNLFGGAERLRVDGQVAGIGAQTGGEDYTLGVRIDRPATTGADTVGFVEARIEHLEEEDFTSDGFTLGLGLSRSVSDEVTLEAGLTYSDLSVADATGRRDYSLLSLPLSATWDRRDNRLNATGGFYLSTRIEPFLGFSGTGSGARVTGDGRIYRGFGTGERPFVLAARIQAGTVVGPSLIDTPRDFLFYSGGGGTVRGQPYQSLGVRVAEGGTLDTGGMSFVALSGEARLPVGRKIGLVGFYDAGFVSAAGLFGGEGDWHAGAGVGLRYDTGIGPIRLDVGVPVGGDTGDGVQVYIGIGQAF